MQRSESLVMYSIQNPVHDETDSIIRSTIIYTSQSCAWIKFSYIIHHVNMQWEYYHHQHLLTTWVAMVCSVSLLWPINYYRQHYCACMDQALIHYSSCEHAVEVLPSSTLTIYLLVCNVSLRLLWPTSFSKWWVEYIIIHSTHMHVSFWED